MISSISKYACKCVPFMIHKNNKLTQSVYCFLCILNLTHLFSCDDTATSKLSYPVTVAVDMFGMKETLTNLLNQVIYDKYPNFVRYLTDVYTFLI